MKRIVLPKGVIMFVALSWALCGPCVFAAAAQVMDGFEDDLVLTGLGIPTDFAWTPEGQLLTASKEGAVYVFDDPDSDNSYSVKSLALDLSTVMCENSERGLEGIEVSPTFDTDRFIFLYYTYNKNDNCDEDPFNGPVNRLSRFVLPTSNVIDIASEEVFFETGSVEYDHHNAGAISFGKDGHLYVTVGDGGSTFSAVSQNVENLFGTVIRVTADNNIPSDNPFTFESGEFNSVRCHLQGVAPPGSPAGAKCQEIFAYGLRNPFRFSMDPNTEDGKVRFYLNDVGQAKWEEVNEGGHDFAGANYGWPVREGPCANSKDSGCDDNHQFVDPVYYYYHDSDGGGCVTGGAFVPNGVWAEEFDGSYIYAEYVFHQIYLLRPSNIFEDLECRSCNPPISNWVTEVLTSFEKVLTIKFGPYGNTQTLYYSAADGSIRRVTYVGSGNRSPEAVLLADPTSGPVGTTVQFSAAGSSDFEGDVLSFAWDFDGDGVTDSTQAVDSYTYTSPGVFTPTLTVSDGNGGSRSTSIDISVGNKPVPIIKTPAEGTTYAVGDILTLIGSASDEENGQLPNTSLMWEVRAHHGTHYHPFLALTNGNNIVLQPAPAPEDYEAATNSYVEIILTATDEDGLSTTVTRTIQPRKVQFLFDTEPSGLDIVVDGSILSTPGTATTWEGHSLRVEAPDQSDGDFTYTFKSWTDGGAQLHEIFIPVTEDEAAAATTMALTTFLLSTVSPFVAKFNVMDGTYSPTVSPSSMPVCRPFPLLVPDQILVDGNYSINEEADVYLFQRDDGILEIKQGSPENPGDTIWQSTEEGGDTGDYFTKIQGDANVITKGGTPENKTDTFWKSNSGQTVTGDYFLALNCDGETLSIVQGTVLNPGVVIWNSQPTVSPTMFPSTITPTLSPTTSTTSSTTTSAPTSTTTSTTTTSSTMDESGTETPSVSLLTWEPSVAPILLEATTKSPAPSSSLLFGRTSNVPSFRLSIQPAAIGPTMIWEDPITTADTDDDDFVDPNTLLTSSSNGSGRCIVPTISLPLPWITLKVCPSSLVVLPTVLYHLF